MLNIDFELGRLLAQGYVGDQQKLRYHEAFGSADYFPTIEKVYLHQRSGGDFQTGYFVTCEKPKSSWRVNQGEVELFDPFAEPIVPGGTPLDHLLLVDFCRADTGIMVREIFGGNWTTKVSEISVAADELKIGPYRYIQRWHRELRINSGIRWLNS